ncbi:uncharacterized protein LOC122960766 [Acropora millepora]|uniref:uncharacterized protein LOC122960766 n=1 Tax=Acropora millepora TaxID=45264 RepID=UPI001CF4E2DC|nr:uncharacterized protein LOC122960766 [Acropora millepora]
MEHVRAELENSNGNVNSIWKVLNRCLPRKDQPLSTTEDHFPQANKFNQFDTSVGLSAASRAKAVAEEHNFYTFNQESSCCPINNSPQDVQCSLVEFQSVTEEEVGKIIRSLPSNKAPGLDKVTARVLKDSLPTTLSAIRNPVNTSFSSNTFARAWKLAEVIPLVKSGDAEEPSNTRPISLLPIMSKVCERAAHSQFTNVFDQNEKNCQAAISSTASGDVQASKISGMVWILSRKTLEELEHKDPHEKEAGLREFRDIHFKKGLPQGDSLCPTLFTLSLNPIAWKLRAASGYKLLKPISCKVIHLLYIDDLKMYASSENNFERVMRTVKGEMD